MRRLLAVSAATLAAGLAARYLAGRVRPVEAAGNGHAGDHDRTAQLRSHIAAARRRLHDQIDSVRGD
jgi:hypothetical protein